VVKFDWNSLRMGDGVLVHDARDTNLALVHGIVGIVDSKTRRSGVNGIGIRVPDGDHYQVLWPSHLAVHRDPPDQADPCWRCTALRQVAAGTS